LQKEGYNTLTVRDFNTGDVNLLLEVLFRNYLSGGC